jgi:hypothetical protein
MVSQLATRLEEPARPGASLTSQFRRTKLQRQSSHDWQA